MPRKAGPEKIVPLTSFQRAWINDTARYKLAVKSRRIGFTFGTTLEIALDVLERRTRWLIVSRTEETAKEAMRECAKHLTGFKLAAEDVAVSESDSEFLRDGIRIKVFVVDLPNGSEIRAMTAHPDAVRGFGGNILLDEFGFHRESIELWRAATGAIMRGHRLVVVSTPNFQQGKYFDLAREAGLTDGAISGEWRGVRDIWSCHFVDLEAAAPQLKKIGVPVNVAEMRKLAGDEESFLQEFMCRFLTSAEMWISLELVAKARSPLANLEWDPDREYHGPLYYGADLARRRDLFVVYVFEQIADLHICRGLIVRRAPTYEEMENIICAVAEHPQVVRGSIDATGMGDPVLERCRNRVGGKVEGVYFNLQTKEAMARLMKEGFEKVTIRIPENAPALEKSIQAVKRITSTAGNLRFDAARTEAGHADEFWAMALAENAASTTGWVDPDDIGTFGTPMAAPLGGTW